MPSFVITHLDLGPEELADLLPVRATVVRVMPGSDRPDYLLCRPDSVISFRPPSGFDMERVQPALRAQDAPYPLAGVRFLVICTRFVGEAFRVGMTDLAVNIAYVIDESLAEDESIDFGKLEFAAVGFIDDSPDAPSSAQDSE